MKRKFFALASVIGAAALVSAGSTTATAKIRCHGQNQYNSLYGSVPSIYCQDEYLATVARAYGMRVSGNSIRASINKKARVCRLVGNDIRVQHICGGINDRGRRRRYP